jgi:hypothetical protein
MAASYQMNELFIMSFLHRSITNCYASLEESPDRYDQGFFSIEIVMSA